MSETVTYKRVYYIAVQDGKYNNEEYDSYAAADAARHQLPPMDRNSTCVMHYLKEVQ